MVDRTFRDLEENEVIDSEQRALLANLGWSGSITWADLLASKRILLISEAGSGKTFECKRQAQVLWECGEPAFFVELSTLANSSFRDTLDIEEETRLDAWLLSQSDVATFFLDSIDELNLSLGSFQQAIKSFSKAINGQLCRARIIITTRPIPFDRQVVRRFLPIPPSATAGPSAESFAEIAMGEQENRESLDDASKCPDWRTVALLPLSDAQIKEFSSDEGVDDPLALLKDLRQRNAEEFARRPQDLIELCSDWREEKRIRTHLDQVKTNVRVKLQPGRDDKEIAQLSADKALEGASRLALAMLATRRLTIRHNAAADDVKTDSALDPATILSDWAPNERKALLERALFGFASYGRVRFHHRSVAEYLAAYRLNSLLDQGMSFRALKRLLFAETKGRFIVRPSKRPIAGWLALNRSRVFELLRDCEPSVLFNEGDPESLTESQRIQTLRAFVKQYGPGGARGLNVPHIQIHRFASEGLANEIKCLWGAGIENPDVRETLLSIIAEGPIHECADLAYGVACSKEISTLERMISLDALVKLADERLQNIAVAVALGDENWPEEMISAVILRMFPEFLSTEQLCCALRNVTMKPRTVGDLSWQLPRLIRNIEPDQVNLELLRDGLVELVSEGLSWTKEWPHVASVRPHLSNALAAVCVRGLKHEKNAEWFRASVLAWQLRDRDYSSDEPVKLLCEQFASMTAEENESLFWAYDQLMQSLHQIDDPWKRLAEIVLHNELVNLNANRDLHWIKNGLSNTNASVGDRALLLEAAMRLSPDAISWKEHVTGLKHLVSDQPDLISKIVERLKPSKHDGETKRWERRASEQRKQSERKKLKAKASWIQLWREIADHPDVAFSQERKNGTAWDLWRVMKRYGENHRESGWNRRFIEEQFGAKTAEQLREILMEIWRNDQPTLPRERPEDQRNTYLVWWQLGLAGIYAEAEDQKWVTKLSVEEAELACRYAPIELNGLPHWMKSLVRGYPEAVDTTLGEELSWELEQKPRGQVQSMLLQSIKYADETVAEVFIPRIRNWLTSNGGVADSEDHVSKEAQRLRQVVEALLKHGDKDLLAWLKDFAHQRLQVALPKDFAFIWLPVLMKLEPKFGVEALEAHLQGVEPSSRSLAVTWFSLLFGDRSDAVDLKHPEFSAGLLLRTARLAYHHVRPEDDAVHEGTYSPDTRDHAERARNEIISAIFALKGEEGWNAKLEMVRDPTFGHFKDRILAKAQESWAHEIDSVAYDDSQAVSLDKTGEAPPSTNESMFVILKDRLADLDELLLRDISPREAWAGFGDERVLRRELARELHQTANGLYKVDQEAVTADEKETDIRLRSVVSDNEAVIELKLADDRTARDLRDTIFNQLVRKYMAADTCASGCLLITLARDRNWEHPDTKKRIGLEELKRLLEDEAKRIEESMAGAVALAVHILDLRPRLPKEKV